MNSPNSIDVSALQLKIDEKLYELQRRNNRTKLTKSLTKDKTKDLEGKVTKLIKWNTITRHLQQMKKQNNGKHFEFKNVEPKRNKGDILDIVNRIMLLQKSLIVLSANIGNYRRIQIGVIFFQCSLSIIFNAYNLVVFLLQLVNNTGNVPLSLKMLLLFYGYHIYSSMADVIVSVMAYHGVYEMIRKTATKVDELNMYIFDSNINARISQLSTYVYNNLRTFTLFGLYNIDGSLITSIISGTTTYIIILIQYSNDGEISNNPRNNLNMSNTDTQI